MTADSAIEFLNRVDDPSGEPWMVRVRSIAGTPRLEIGEAQGHPLDVEFDIPHAKAFAAYLRTAEQRVDSFHRTIDKRYSSDEVYVRIDRMADSTWRIFLANRRGDVELFVDQSTMRRLVDMIATAFDGEVEMS
jgi:hypothetical protein